MNKDVQKAITANSIKHGSRVTYATTTGILSKKDPVYPTMIDISTIEYKYNNRFDDPSYYHGCDVDGGDV